MNILRNDTGFGSLLGVTLVGFLSGPAAFAQDALPEGEGMELTAELCTGCHGIDRFAGLRQTEEEWRQVVMDMIAAGLQIFPEEAEEVVEYLSTNLGPEDP